MSKLQVLFFISGRVKPKNNPHRTDVEELTQTSSSNHGGRQIQNKKIYIYIRNFYSYNNYESYKIKKTIFCEYDIDKIYFDQLH